MAYAIDSSTYTYTELDDTLSGSPDYWTDSGSVSHSYASSELTWTKSGAGLMTSSVGSINAAQRYYRFTWKYTADNGSTPIIFATINAGNTVIGVGMYIDFSTNTLFARDGAAWTSTGATLATSTEQEVEYVVDRTTGTYDLYFDGSLNGTYDIDTNTDAAFSTMSFGGGTSGATYTGVLSDTFLAKDTLSTGAVPISASPLAADADLINYYTLDNTANDDTGAANGTFTGAAYTGSTPFSNVDLCADLSANTAGSGSPSAYISAAFYSPGASDFTYYGWWKFATLPGSTRQELLCNEENGATGRPHIHLTKQSAASEFELSVSDASASTSIVTSGVGVTTGVWYQIAYTRTGGTGTLYVNGASEGTMSDSYTTISTSNGQIGRRFNSTYSGTQFAFDGQMSDVAMFSRALTAEEIENLYNGFPVTSVPDLRLAFI